MDAVKTHKSPPHEPPAKSGHGQQIGLLLLAGVVIALLLAKWTLLVAILGLAFLILAHEFGHFVFAKLFGMRVEKFYIGFPPAAWKRQRGETEYGIGLIPLGGFCKISGMTEEETAVLPDDVKSRAYYNQKVWKRNLTIFGGPLFNFVVAGMIVLVTLLAVGQSEGTLTIRQVEPTMQAAAIALSPAGSSKAPSVSGQTPAAAIGLKAGDTLVGADGQAFKTWNQAQTFFQNRPNRTIALTYRTPQGAVTTTQVKLAANPDGSGHGFLGVDSVLRSVRPYPWLAVGRAAKNVGVIFKDTFVGFWWLISGKIGFSGKDGAAGPVGIVSLSQTAVRQHFYTDLLAYVSINLGVINLLPLLPFDGGHIFFNTIESVRRGRRVDRRVIERAAVVGVVLLVTLFFLLTFNDVRRIFGG
jgi:regulator of sigma E protease